MIILHEQLPQIKQNLKKDIKIDTDKDHIISVCSSELEDMYRMIGVVSFLHDGDIDALHHNMYPDPDIISPPIPEKFIEVPEEV